MKTLSHVVQIWCRDKGWQQLHHSKEECRHCKEEECGEEWGQTWVRVHLSGQEEGGIALHSWLWEVDLTEEVEWGHAQWARRPSGLPLPDDSDRSKTQNWLLRQGCKSSVQPILRGVSWSQIEKLGGEWRDKQPWSKHYTHFRGEQQLIAEL